MFRRRLAYEVKKPEPGAAEIPDERGTVWQTLVQPNQEKGPQTVSADVADRPSGSYFYRVTTCSGGAVRRFIGQ